MEQNAFPDFWNSKEENKTDLGSGLVLEIVEGRPRKAVVHKYGVFLKEVDLSDKTAKRFLVMEVVALGAIKSRLASALEISRQSIHNYVEAHRHFGPEGLLHNYPASRSKSRRTQREMHAAQRREGDTAQQLAEICQQRRDEQAQRQPEFDYSFGAEPQIGAIPDEEQPFAEEHPWAPTRYAGVFAYGLTLIAEWRWLHLVQGHFHRGYKIFWVFVLMAAHNIRSIEQLKNVHSREAGRVLGIGCVPAKPKIWQWFYAAAQTAQSQRLRWDYFRYQAKTGLIGLWLWFTDGHLLPYSGKQTVHSAYHTQRRMPFPGRTNFVTTDGSGRVVDFTIAEGKGNLREHIVGLAQKWAAELGQAAVAVFDREGHGMEFFYQLIENGVPFVTWEKNVDAKKLADLEDDQFVEQFAFNGKDYGVFEEEKPCLYTEERVEEEPVRHPFTLRRIYVWNRTSRRRSSGLAWSADREMSTVDCARAILSRWGASENTFKHLKDRHPLHYHPGFKLVESDRQDVKNPLIKEKERQIGDRKKGLSKLYKKLAKAREVLTKEGRPRKNSVKERLKASIAEEENTLERLIQEKGQLPERVDVSTLEDYKSFKKIDNEGKYLFDFVTTSVWNARKQMVDWLRPFFDDEDELVDLFYAITYCHGWIQSTATEVIVRLEPLQQPKRRLAQEQLCRKLTSLGAQTPTGKRMAIEVGASPL
jgi:hypothetical protein